MLVSWISLGLAVAALVITLRREWLDRARVRVLIDAEGNAAGLGQLIATIENQGRQPTIISGIGVAWDAAHGVLPGPQRGELLLNDPKSRARLEGGGVTQVTWDAKHPGVHLDMPMRGFVEYGRGKRAWTRPRVPFRELSLLGWGGDIPAELTAGPPSREKVRGVVPRWKLWRAKNLRKPTSAQPSFSEDEVQALRRAQG